MTLINGASTIDNSCPCNDLATVLLYSYPSPPTLFSSSASLPISLSALFLSVQKRKPPSRSTSLLTQTSPDRDSLDEAVSSAWESMWHNYAETNVETVGLDIDPEKLRARVLRGVEEEESTG